MTVIRKDPNDIKDMSRSIKKSDIPERWKRFMTKKLLEDFNKNIEDWEDIEPVMKRWQWTISKAKIHVYEVINILDYLGASTVRDLVHEYWDTVLDKDIILLSAYEEDRRRKLFGRALKKLFNCKVVTKIKLKENQVGKGKFTVSIWISPFCKDDYLQLAIDDYLLSGGNLGKGEEKKKRSELERAKELVGFGQLVKEIKETTKRDPNKLYMKCSNCGIRFSKPKFLLSPEEIEAGISFKDRCSCGSNEFVPL